MRLYWVELDNWRQHSKTRIDFHQDATVVYGSNETGKSTILEALSRGFFDKSSSQAEAIKSVRPLTASGNVTSTVRIEFTIDKTRYRLEKRFNLRRGTALYKIVGEKSVLQAQDNSADEELTRLLEAELPSPRGSKPSQWGAFRWLWAPQDNRELPTAKDGDPTLDLHLERSATTGTLATPKFRAVQSLVQAAYAEYFSKTGKTANCSPVLIIGEEVQTRQQRNSELNKKIKSVEDEKQQLDEYERQLPLLEKELADSKEELETARSEAADFSSIEAQLNASKAAVTAAKRDVDDAAKAMAELEKAAHEIEELQEKEKSARTDQSRLEASCELLEMQQQTVREKVDERAMQIRECEELAKDARILWAKADAKKKTKELDTKIKRIGTITHTIEGLRKKRVALSPSSEEVEELSQTQIRIEALKESLATRGFAVTVIPGENGALDVDVDGERLGAKALTACGAESVRVGTPGLGDVMVRAELEGARDAKVDIARLEDSIHAELRKYSVSSIDELRELNRQQADIAQRIEVLEAERRGIDERPVKEISLELSRFEEQYDEYQKIERTLTAENLNRVDVDLGDLINQREKEEKDTRSALDEARAARDDVDEELRVKKEERAGVAADQKNLSEKLDNARNRERDVIRLYGSVENQRKVLRVAQANLDKRTEEHNRAKEKHKQLEKGPVSRIARLQTQIENQEEVIRQQRAYADQLKGAINLQSLDGVYSELAIINSRIEILQERFETQEVHADACKLLKKTLEEQYRSGLLAVIGPIQEEVRRCLSYATGLLHDDVELNEYLFPVRLGERGFEGISLEFSDASSGLKETLALCVRLAVAEHLSKSEAQCLVLDDPFVHVSPDRSNKMVELINDTIRECGLQVIVLTHRPMEFAGFGGTMVDIQSVKQGGN